MKVRGSRKSGEREKRALKKLSTSDGTAIYLARENDRAGAVFVIYAFVFFNSEIFTIFAAVPEAFTRFEDRACSRLASLSQT